MCKVYRNMVFKKGEFKILFSTFTGWNIHAIRNSGVIFQ